MARKDEVGARGETIAAAYLEELGYEVVDRNWRHGRRGEIDLVARDGDETVFVEVKTRSGTAFGHPLEAVTAEKLARLRMLAGAWCRSARVVSSSIRIDAVSVLLPPGRAVDIEHVRGVG
ncbi:YraN family protein [Agromyces mangrovi Wang et al. 2018]|uniref:YraN family protein n=1 Tax=Agromyces mangrovi TaxID=1858653 RepID=UPI0025727C69|nr:YraN family protein [Agromyces mangrovi]BDZ63213.1 UPF0102 protein [Agromyces mangrovi]